MTTKEYFYTMISKFISVIILSYSHLKYIMIALNEFLDSWLAELYVIVFLKNCTLSI